MTDHDRSPLLLCPAYLPAVDRVDVEGGGSSACQSGGGVVVLAGETLARLTNGYFRPTFHEVVGGSAGYS